MQKFQYSALSADGTTVSGTHAGATLRAVHEALRVKGLEPINVVPKKGFLQFELTKKKVPRKDLMHFSRQLSVFIKAGIPILEALELIGSGTTNKVFSRVLAGMIEALQAGDTFADAAAAFPEAFPSFYTGILASAELTGNLDIVLDQLGTYIERDVEARQKVKSALMYPSIVILMSIVVVCVLAGFVLPRFKTFFTSLNAKLPLPTRMLLAVTNFFTSWWYLVVGGVALIVTTFLVARATKGGRAALDALFLKLPIIGDLIRHTIIERFCRLLASMLKAGVSLPEAITVTAESARNLVYRRGLMTAREQMLEGEGLAVPLSRTGLFPDAARQMLRVGENTGTLDTQLETAAIFYERELDYRVKRFTNLLEPAVIVFVGIVVGFVALALVSAMYGIYHQVHVGT
jgi:type IV pilus assembly protein PilC